MKPRNETVPASLGLVRRTERATRVATALVGILLAVIAGLTGLSGIGHPLVTLSYDIPFIVHRAGGAEGIRMVYLTELDQQSLDRKSQARLLDRLAEEGATMVVYDLIFDRPSEEPAVDREFAAAMRRFRGVDENGTAITGAVQRRIFLGCARDTSRKTGYAMETLVVPTEALLDAADDFGLVAFNADAFMIRRLTTGTPDEPSLAWKAAQAAGAKLDEEFRMAPRWFNFASPPPGTDSRGGVPIESVDAGTLLAGQTMSGFFRGKIVIVGGQPGIVGQQLGADLFETPFHRFPVTGRIPLMSGVEVQANALANLLNHNWLTRSPERSDRPLVIGAGILLGGLLSLLRPVRAILVALGLTTAFAAAGLITVHYRELWFPWTVPAFLQVPAALVWGIAANTYVERFLRIKLSAEQKAIREAFAKYLSPQMLDRLTLEGFKTKLGGDKVHAAVMFTDIEGFTKMSTRIRDPQRIVETLNDYFERTTASVFDHDGVIIKYIGDAIYAAWGTPISDPQAALNATRAAWRLFENDKLHVEGHEHPTRIGVHYGEVVAGNIGSSRRVDYTLIGDAVNLASRMESLNKILGTYILISGDAHAFIGDEFRTRYVGDFIVVGRDEPVAAHELLGPAREKSEPDWIAAYHRALGELKAGRAEAAREEFARVASLRGPAGDGPSAFFIKHIDAGTILPGGIVQLTEK
jgi:adenylate cyclase